MTYLADFFAQKPSQHIFLITKIYLFYWLLPKMNHCCYCHPIGCSPKWTALPKKNNCCSCPPIGHSPKRALPNMNIWKKPWSCWVHSSYERNSEESRGALIFKGCLFHTSGWRERMSIGQERREEVGGPGSSWFSASGLPSQKAQHHHLHFVKVWPNLGGWVIYCKGFFFVKRCKEDSIRRPAPADSLQATFQSKRPTTLETILRF